MILLINKNIRSFLLIVFLLGTSVVFHAQKKKIIENGAIFKLKYNLFQLKFPKRIVGNLIESEFKYQTIKTLDGDTIILSLDSVRKAYFPDKIRLYTNGKFHFKSAKIFDYSMGFADNHFNSDYVFGERLDNNFEFGIGTGIHYNSSVIYTTNSANSIEVISIPIFIQLKYAPTKHNKRLYFKSRVGLMNNIRTWNMTSIKRGILFENGVGLLFPSRSRWRCYMELTQYNSYAKGSINATDPNIISDIDFKIWFNRVIFTFGIEFGKIGKGVSLHRFEL